MPDRPLTIATYAAGASLMAITLVYVFGPTFFLDNDAAHGPKLSRKKGVVGLANPANDCFINSVLQALAGLPELRQYLIREMHRRELDGPAAYASISAALEEEDKRKGGKPVPDWMRIGLQQGLVTAGLKEMLDALNERPIFRKTISAQAFIRAVEQAFNTRVSRSQQDAQEFLQVVVERLADEHTAAQRVRRNHRLVQTGIASSSSQGEQDPHDHDADTEIPSRDTDAVVNGTLTGHQNDIHGTQEAFPMEGQLESQVECLVCQFKPKPSKSSFLTLTLNVPHNESSTTLNACFDGVFKVEHIEDFKCDRCRLEHAIQINEQKIPKAASEERRLLESYRHKLESALREDPEVLPKDVPLPPLSAAPKRRIARHTRISTFPRLLVLHLSRSIWDPHSVSSKNTAKVAFPETLPLGSLLDRKNYRLLGVVTHKGGHHSGHYESFRRQMLVPPYSTRASLGTDGIYSLRTSPAPSASSSPQLRSMSIAESISASVTSPTAAEPESRSPSISDPLPSTAPSSQDPARSVKPRPVPSTPPPLDSIPTPGLPDPPFTGGKGPTATTASTPPTRTSSIRGPQLRRRRKQAQQQPERWWRISDEKVKECKTSEVLGMQQEVYLLFYEMVIEGDERASG